MLLPASTLPQPPGDQQVIEAACMASDEGEICSLSAVSPLGPTGLENKTLIGEFFKLPIQFFDLCEQPHV